MPDHDEDILFEDLDFHDAEARDEQVLAFAIACFDDNSVEELSSPHSADHADPTDMETWDIDAWGWSSAVSAALNERLRVDDALPK